MLAYWRRRVRNRRIVKQWEEEEQIWWDFEEDEEVQ
jgi:hypothetical protein